MKKKKNLIIILSVIIVGIIIIVSVFSILNSRKLKKENIDTITTSYNNLTDDIKKYNEIRTKYNKRISSFVMSTYENEQEEYITLLNEYNEVIKKIDTEIKQIDKKCDIIYDDININKICSNYKGMYEKLINLYITDINMYNENIKKYNEYKKTSIESFELVHKDYIDYNNDGTYEGRSTNEKNKTE